MSRLKQKPDTVWYKVHFLYRAADGSEHRETREFWDQPAYKNWINKHSSIKAMTGYYPNHKTVDMKLKQYIVYEHKQTVIENNHI